MVTFPVIVLKYFVGENGLVMSFTEVFCFQQDFSTQRCKQCMEEQSTKLSDGIPVDDQMAKNGYISLKLF